MRRNGERIHGNEEKWGAFWEVFFEGLMENIWWNRQNRGFEEDEENSNK